MGGATVLAAEQFALTADGFHPTTRAHYIGAEFIFKATFFEVPVTFEKMIAR
jgi:phospholipase/lecithinase/hemolysin